MWKRRKTCYEFWYDDKKSGFITFQRVNTNEIHFSSVVNGKTIYKGASLADAMMYVEDKF